MSIYDYEGRFGAEDKTSKAMRAAIEDWFDLYYLADTGDDRDPCQRIAYTVVNKLVKAMFAEYSSTAGDSTYAALLQRLEAEKKQAVQLALVGGECYLKPCPEAEGFGFCLIPRNNLLVFARDARGMPTDVGCLERSTCGKYYYTLLERRMLDGQGFLIIENQLYRAAEPDSLGTRVSLGEHPGYSTLQERYRFSQPLGGIGLVRLKTPMLNCVDGTFVCDPVGEAGTQAPSQLDRLEAQLVYTAMMTDTLLEA